MSQTTWTSFGPDQPPSALAANIQACLPPNQPTRACDKLIGSATQNYGFCADPAYRQMTYCACVNNTIGCPEYAMASCANSAYSYKPWAWYQPSPGGQPSRDSTCAKAPICVNLVEIGGSQNIVSGVTQQCGVITNITNVLKTNPTLAVLAFLLFITLIIVMSMHADDSGGMRGPPPPPGMIGDAPSMFGDEPGMF